MEIKPQPMRSRRRKRFVDPWFLALLLVVAVGVFTVSDLYIGSILRENELRQLEINPLDEAAVYNSSTHTPKEDFALLSQGHFSNLNGGPASQSVGTEQPLATVIENYTPIRDQQSGLDQASIVYETLAEGGITRLLAIFDGTPADRIGPIRSARPYFVDWASEYGAALVHVGGSNAALENLKTNPLLFNIDEMSDSKTVWRDNTYLAPHNAFTSTDKILARLKEKNYSHPLTSPRFPFKEKDAAPGTIKTLTIDFSFPAYKVKYVYDPATSLYSRFNGGVSDHDLKAADVLVQFADTKVLDDVGRLQIQTSGTGKALVFQDGKVIEGTWKEDAQTDSDGNTTSRGFTRFYDKDGKEIPLNRGQIWIEVVPNDRPVNYF
jgi:Protein of unknown function (DUF3048) N-terminal domain/Protein of unknown function (DUF3048) C-terminal domain